MIRSATLDKWFANLCKDIDIIELIEFLPDKKWCILTTEIIEDYGSVFDVFEHGVANATYAIKTGQELIVIEYNEAYLVITAANIAEVKLMINKALDDVRAVNNKLIMASTEKLLKDIRPHIGPKDLTKDLTIRIDGLLEQIKEQGHD